MGVISRLGQQLNGAHDLLESTAGEIPDEQAHDVPTGLPATVAGQYAHLLPAADFLSSLADGSTPLMMSAWAGKTGISEPPGGSWEQWGKTVTVYLARARAYARALYGKTDGIGPKPSVDDPAEPCGLSMFGFGLRDVGSPISAIVATHPVLHAGEISAVKRLAGLHR